MTRKASTALGAGALLCGAALFALVFLLTSPGCQSPGESAVDAGAAFDAGADASFFDAGRDAEPLGDAMIAPLWVPVENMRPMAEGCEAYRATRPEDVLRIGWIPCGEGCQQLDLGPEWLPADQGSHRDGVASFTVGRIQERDPSRADQPTIYTAVYSTVERPTVAFQVRVLPFLDSYCLAGGENTQGFLAIAALTDRHDQPQHIRRVFVTDVTTPTWPLPYLFEAPMNPGSVLQQPAASEDIVAYQNQPNARVLLAHRATGEWRYLSDLAPGYAGNPQKLLAVGRDLFYEVWASRQLSVAHASLDTDAELFLALPLEERADVFGFETDGVDMAWLQGYGRECSYGCPDDHDRLEVWTSPYATRPEDLRPRRVGEIPDPASRGITAIGGGRYATIDDAPVDGRAGLVDVVVFDLTTGRMARWHPPEGWSAFGPLDLHETEMLVYARRLDEYRRTLFRVDIASLRFE